MKAAWRWILGLTAALIAVVGVVANGAWKSLSPSYKGFPGTSIELLASGV